MNVLILLLSLEKLEESLLYIYIYIYIYIYTQTPCQEVMKTEMMK
jgi:hypothetical protein